MMKQRINILTRSQVTRYILTGGTAYAIELLTMFLLLIWGLTVINSVAVSFWVGLIVSFVLQKIIAFEDRRKSSRLLLYQAFVYGLLIIFNYAFTLLFVSSTVAVLGIYFSRTIALGTTTIWNYFIYKFIFKTK